MSSESIDISTEDQKWLDLKAEAAKAGWTVEDLLEIVRQQGEIPLSIHRPTGPEGDTEEAA